MQNSYTHVENFGWGKLEYFKSLGGTTKRGVPNFEISVGEAKRGNPNFDSDLVGESWRKLCPSHKNKPTFNQDKLSKLISK